MLEVRGLRKHYGDVVAADGVDLTVERGRITGFLGPNGAGKSTVMRSVFGLVDPDAGEIRLDGASIDAPGLRRIGYLPEQRGLYPKMPIGEQVEFFGRLKGMPAAEARRVGSEVLGELGLGDRLASPLDQLSHGNQQRVQLAVALVHEPDVLLLDEPFNGLDPVAVLVLADLLRARADAGAAVLFSSHQLDVVTDLVDDVTIIAAGTEVGQLLITREGLPDTTIPLYTESAVEKASFLPRLEVAAWALAGDVFRGRFGIGDPAGTE